MTPAAVLSLLVKTEGATVAAAELKKLDATAATAGRTLDKGGASAQKHSRLLGTLSSAAKTAGLVMGAAGLAKGISVAVSEYREAQKVGAQTNAVLKSTGGVANITRKGIENLAGAISKKSGIDDEAIQKGENLLLTFTKIRNETGKGNDIFNQATQSITDMSVALGQDMKSSAIQLGKALNDPIKGVTALRRVGVSFTESQQKQIKTLEETGHHLEAQKMILREVRTEFGGSAAAQATAGDKMKVALNNLAEAAGRFLVPAMDKVMTVLTSVINQFIEGKGIATVIIPIFTTLAAVVRGIVGPIVDLVKGFQDGKTWAVVLGTAIIALTAGLVAYKLITGAITLATQAWTAAQTLLNITMDANPIVLVIAGIAALVAAFVIAYEKSDTFRGIIDKLWDVLSSVFSWVKDHWPLLLGILTGPFGLAVVVILKHGGEIKDAIVGAFHALIDAVKGLAGSIVGLGTWTINRIVEGVKATAGAVIAIGGWLKNRIMDGLDAVVGAVRSVGGWIINRVVDGIRAEIAGLLAIGGWIKNRVLDGLNAVIDAVRGLGGWVIHRLVEGIRVETEGLLNTGAWIKNRLLDGLSAVKDGFLGLGSKIIDWIVDGLKAGANKLVGFLDDIIDVINKIPGVNIGKIKGFKSGGEVAATGFAKGGAFGLTGGNVNKPMVMMGEEAPRYPEFVIPTNPAYRKRAQSLLASAAGAVGFAEGGILGGLPGVGDLPDWIKGTGTYVLGKVSNWIKDKFVGLLGGAVDAIGDLLGGGENVLSRVLAMVSKANEINSQHFPYVYGGGHGSFNGPYDCSGAVSAVLHAAGYLGSPITTDGLKVFGDPGDGKYVTVGVRGSTGMNAHTMMKIGNRYFESGSGHGAQWTGGWSGDFPIHRHPPGMAQGGILTALKPLLDPSSPNFVGWGLRHGGTIPYGGSFGDGGVVPGPMGAPRMILAHGGEEVSARGRGGDVYIDKAVFGSRSDPYLLADRLAWRLSLQ